MLRLTASETRETPAEYEPDFPRKCVECGAEWDGDDEDDMFFEASLVAPSRLLDDEPVGGIVCRAHCAARLAERRIRRHAKLALELFVEQMNAMARAGSDQIALNDDVPNAILEHIDAAMLVAEEDAC